MIHLWKLNNLDLELNIEELLKYRLLGDIYINDKSTSKQNSTQYFRYLDFMTNSNGYCIRNGLSFNESHFYSLKHCKFTEDFKFPDNNKEIIEFVKKEIEQDVITDSILSCIKSLRISSKSINRYIDLINELHDTDFKDEKGNFIDLSLIVTKMLKQVSDIPSTIKIYEELLERQKQNNVILRGTGEYSSSMDGDDEIESHLTN